MPAAAEVANQRARRIAVDQGALGDLELDRLRRQLRRREQRLEFAADAVAIVRAVLSLAEALGMSTTAEGIETVELATTLATLGCASGQGYYFAKPLEADAALEYWNSRRR